MAIWGPKLYESDSTCDIRDTFHNLLDSGLPPDCLEQKIRDYYPELFLDSDEGEVVELALADQLRSVGALSEAGKEWALFFLREGGDLAFWEHEAPHLVEARKKELKLLERRFRTPRKISSKKKKQLAWKIGEIYAVPMESPEARKLGFQNEYILVYFWGERRPIGGYRSPEVWVKITQNGHLPQNAEEFNKLPYVQACATEMEKRFAPFSGEDQLPAEYRQSYIPDAWGCLPEYNMTLYEALGHHPPDSLILLGQLTGILPPTYNYRRYKSNHGASWKYLEEDILRRYRLYTLHEAHCYQR